MSSSVFPVPFSGIQETLIDAKGDLIAGSAADKAARLAVGSNDTVLTADSTTATGLKWAAASSSGLNLISTQTVNGTSTSFNNCFTSTYTNYLIMVNDSFAAGVTDINMRLRVSGADDTSANYFWTTVSNNTNGTIAGTQGTASSGWTQSYGSASNAGYQVFVFSPQVSAVKTSYSGTFFSRSGDKGGATSGFFDLTSSYDGFTIYTSNTMVGNISVYGLAK
jgi:hypothetical protein